MGDVFKEQIVKQRQSTADLLKKIGIAFVAAVLALVLLMTPVGALGIFAAGFGVYYLFSFFNKEFEYAFTNGSLDIDVIYNRSRRKRVFSGDVKDFELMARTDDKDRAHAFANAQAVCDYSSGNTGAVTYAFLAKYKDKRVKVIIEPNEMMLKAFATVLTPRKFFRQA